MQSDFVQEAIEFAVWDRQLLILRSVTETKRVESGDILKESEEPSDDS